MGKVNNAMLDYLKDKERFADFFNANLFEGRKVVIPEQLVDRSETYIIWQSIAGIKEKK